MCQTEPVENEAPQLCPHLKASRDFLRRSGDWESDIHSLRSPPVGFTPSKTFGRWTFCEVFWMIFLRWSSAFPPSLGDGHNGAPPLEPRYRDLTEVQGYVQLAWGVLGFLEGLGRRLIVRSFRDDQSWLLGCLRVYRSR